MQWRGGRGRTGTAGHRMTATTAVPGMLTQTTCHQTWWRLHTRFVGTVGTVKQNCGWTMWTFRSHMPFTAAEMKHGYNEHWVVTAPVMDTISTGLFMDTINTGLFMGIISTGPFIDTTSTGPLMDTISRPIYLYGQNQYRPTYGHNQ